jgi:hypothetical protein
MAGQPNGASTGNSAAAAAACFALSILALRMGSRWVSRSDGTCKSEGGLNHGATCNSREGGAIPHGECFHADGRQRIRRTGCIDGVTGSNQERVPDSAERRHGASLPGFQAVLGATDPPAARSSARSAKRSRKRQLGA